jgi:hypothetical protein
VKYNEPVLILKINNKICNIDIKEDKEVGVLCASSEDIPGLATEAKTIDELVDKISIAGSELLELNYNNTEGC